MKVLLCVDSPTFSGAVLNELSQRNEVSLADITVVTYLEELPRAGLENSSFDAVVSVSASEKAHSVHRVSELLALARPGACVTLQEPVSSSPSSAEDVSSVAKLQQQALLGGMTQGATAQAYSLPLLSGRKDIQPAAVEGRKPAWETGAQQSIKLKQKAVAPAMTLPPATIWSSMHADDAELLDDEELLTEEDLVRPEVPVVDGCATTRKACKNCTCGRAEAEAADAPPPKLTTDMIENPGAAGGCGSCALGDAFRCTSCPYRGLPSFTPGKKIELPAGFLSVDL